MKLPRPASSFDSQDEFDDYLDSRADEFDDAAQDADDRCSESDED